MTPAEGGRTMRAAIFRGPGAITVGDRPYPVVVQPTDAVVRVALSSVCGTDVSPFRGESSFEPGPIGHEFVGVVEDVGTDVRAITNGDLVIAPTAYSDGTCPHCRAGITTACVAGGFWTVGGIDGGQGEAVRVPFADATLVRVPGSDHSEATMRSLLALSDVMGTGHHAAVSAGVEPGSVVAVIGDGAVGLCAIIAAQRLGAGRIIALSRNPIRQALARSFGATDVVAERGDGAAAAVLELTDRVGVDAALECVGTGQSFTTAVAVTRPGGMVGYVGVPHDVQVPIDTMFLRNVGLRGGAAPVRTYIPELLDDVLQGRIDPGRVFDFETDLEGIAEAYAAMEERRAVKSLIRLGAI
jgi:threonine dehydrogenase-like Zn-dependent dehydrogenase